MTSMKPLVFVSCGQVTESEKRLGKTICELVRKAGLEPFLAENQSDFHGLNENILGALNDAQGLIFVMHPRGIVTDHSGATWSRGSVWIEQEIAIAAFIQQTRKSK